MYFKAFQKSGGAKCKRELDVNLGKKIGCVPLPYLNPFTIQGSFHLQQNR